MHRAALTIALLAACTSPADRAAKERLLSRAESRGAPAAFDRARPETALRIGAEEAAARLGSFEWTATADWTVARGTDPASRVHALERHRVRQLSNGDFEVQSDLDPGLGPGSETGKHLVYVGKMTYARSLYAPFGAFRERPTDRGRDARRYRDESFGLLADLAHLSGARLQLRPVGDGAFLSRPAERYAISLAPEPPVTPRPRGNAPADDDTRRRLAFLEGRMPIEESGECLLDAATGVPLKVKLHGVFQVKDDPQARVEMELTAQMRTLGGATAPVVRPQAVLSDERKPKGVARALEAAGLKKRGQAEMGREEPAEEGE